jgi:arylsulfatase
MWADGWKAVTLHANRMPWELNKTAPFEDDVWELYNVEEDFSESNDLAAEHPDKLEELVEMFDEEAWKNNVYPLYDDMIKRIAGQQDRLFGDQTEYVYYAPGAVRIAEKASAPVKNRSHTIVTSIDLEGDEEGVIVAVGGMTGGFTMYISDGRLVYDYNYLDGVHYKLQSPPLDRGPTELKFNFIKTKEFGGTGELYVNGKQVDEVDMPDMHISTYSLAETFDIGLDTGTQVDPAYAGSPFPFTGALDRVTITLTDRRETGSREIEFID